MVRQLEFDVSVRPVVRPVRPPQVLKTDNGSPFIAAATRALCFLHGVVNLLSPPLSPRYNGSIEATAGQLKARAALIAMQQTCDVWSSDILEAARLSANALNRPWGLRPHPDQCWHRALHISADQRVNFAALVGRKTTDITESTQRERRLIGLPEPLTAACAATVARTAIRPRLSWSLAFFSSGDLRVCPPNSTPIYPEIG